MPKGTLEHFQCKSNQSYYEYAMLLYKGSCQIQYHLQQCLSRVFMQGLSQPYLELLGIDSGTTSMPSMCAALPIRYNMYVVPPHTTWRGS